MTDRVRVVPVTSHPRTVCLRLELCGCELEEGQHQHTWQEVHDKVHNVQEELSGVRASQDTGREMDSLNPNLMSVVIGVLVTIILVLTTVIIFILYKNSLLSPQQSPGTSLHKHEVEPPDLDEYSEYSRPLLGYQHKLLWDVSLPPPPPRQLRVSKLGMKVEKLTVYLTSDLV